MIDFSCKCGADWNAYFGVGAETKLCDKNT